MFESSMVKSYGKSADFAEVRCALVARRHTALLNIAPKPETLKPSLHFDAVVMGPCCREGSEG
jgi:hypothetical protein